MENKFQLEKFLKNEAKRRWIKKIFQLEKEKYSN